MWKYAVIAAIIAALVLWATDMFGMM